MDPPKGLYNQHNRGSRVQNWGFCTRLYTVMLYHDTVPYYSIRVQSWGFCFLHPCRALGMTGYFRDQADEMADPGGPNTSLSRSWVSLSLMYESVYMCIYIQIYIHTYP